MLKMDPSQLQWNCEIPMLFRIMSKSSLVLNHKLSILINYEAAKVAELNVQDGH